MVYNTFNDLHTLLTPYKDGCYINLGSTGHFQRSETAASPRLTGLVSRLIDCIYRVRPAHTPLPTVFRAMRHQVSSVLDKQEELSAEEVRLIQQVKADLTPYHRAYLSRSLTIWQRMLCFFLPGYQRYIDILRSAAYQELNETLDAALKNKKVKQIEVETKPLLPPAVSIVTQEMVRDLPQNQPLKDTPEAKSKSPEEIKREEQERWKAENEKALREAVSEVNATAAEVCAIVPCPPKESCLKVQFDPEIDYHNIKNEKELIAYQGYIEISIEEMFKGQSHEWDLNFWRNTSNLRNLVMKLNGNTCKGFVLDINTMPQIEGNWISEIHFLADLGKTIHLRASGNQAAYLSRPEWGNTEQFMKVVQRIRCDMPVRVHPFHIMEYNGDKNLLKDFFTAFPRLQSPYEEGVLSLIGCPSPWVVKLLARYENIGYVRLAQGYPDALLQSLAQLNCADKIHTIDLCDYFKFSIERNCLDKKHNKSVYSVEALQALNGMPHLKHILTPGRKYYSPEDLAAIQATCPKVVWWDDIDQAMTRLYENIMRIDYYDFEHPMQPALVKETLITIGREMAFLKNLLPKFLIEKTLRACEVWTHSIAFYFANGMAVADSLRDGKKTSEMGLEGRYIAKISKLLFEDQEPPQDITKFPLGSNKRFPSEGTYVVEEDQLDRIPDLCNKTETPMRRLIVDMKGNSLKAAQLVTLQKLLDSKQPDNLICVSNYMVPIIDLKNMGPSEDRFPASLRIARMA